MVSAFENPVLFNELRTRMRGARAYWILFGYVGLLSVILLFAYATWVGFQAGGPFAQRAEQLGSELYTTLVGVQLFLVMFITPAITSGALTMEREQQTIDMLLLTPLSRNSIVAGKLLAAFAFVALLLTASLPLVSVCFMLGSVDPATVLGFYAMALAGSCLVGAIGIAWSSVARSTTHAVVLTYVTVFILAMVTSIVYSMFTNFGGSMHTAGTGTTATIARELFGPGFIVRFAPSGTGFVVLSAMMSMLLVSAASTRLHLRPGIYAHRARAWLFSFVGVLCLGFFIDWVTGWFAPSTGALAGVRDGPIGALAMPAVILLAAVPMLAAGNGTGSTPEAQQAGPASGRHPLIFTCGLAVTVFALYAAAFVIAGRPGSILSASVAQATTPAAARGAGGLLEAMLAILAAVAGFTVLVRAVAYITRSRAAATAIAYIAMVVAVVTPEISHIPAYVGGAAGPGVILYYLNPVQVITQDLGVDSYYNNAIAGSRWLVFGTKTMWLAVTITWLVIAAAAAVVAAVIKIRRRAHAGGLLRTSAVSSTTMKDSSS